MLPSVNLYRFFLAVICVTFGFIFRLPATAQSDSLLLAAIKKDNLPAIQQRLKQPININAADSNGVNALMWATYYGSLPTVRYLVQQGAKVPDTAVIYIHKTNHSYSSLQGIAAGEGKLELLQYLLDSLQLPLHERAFNLRSKKKDGLTILALAACYGHIDIVQYLLSKGVRTDIADADDIYAPLMVAASAEQWDIFTLLMRTGANKKRFGKRREYFLAMAAKLKHAIPTEPVTAKNRNQFVLKLREACFGKRSLGYAIGLRHPAYVYSSKGEYGKAEALLKKTISLLKILDKEDHQEYVFALTDLGLVLFNRGHYEEAVDVLNQAISIIKKTYGEENVDYSVCLRWLALTYTRMGIYDTALLMYPQILDLTKKLQGAEHSCYLMTLNHFSFLYRCIGSYQQAIPLYEKSLGIIKNERGEDNESYGGNLLDLATTYRQLGQYKEAFPLLEKAEGIMKRALGEKHQYYAMTIAELGFINERIGEYEKAEALYKQASVIFKKALGENHTLYASSLNNLASLYLSLGAYPKALPLYHRILTIRKKALKENHPDYAQSLTNLATAYMCKQQYDTAKYLYEQAIKITRKAVGEEHSYYADCLANMASLYMHTGLYDSSLYFYERALQINSKVFGSEYPGNVSILNSVGFLYNIINNNKDLSTSFINASKLQLKYISQTCSTLSEQEKMNFLNKEIIQFYYLPSLLYRQDSIQLSLMQQVYENELALKGMILEDQQEVLKNIRRSGDSMALRLYDRWHITKSLLGKQLLLPVKQRVSYLDSLQNLFNQLEQQLSRRSEAFKHQQYSQHITPNRISRELRKEEAAVEFIRFPYFNRTWTDSILYAALIQLPGDSNIRFVPLCEEKYLSHLLRPAGKAVSQEVIVEKLYGNKLGVGALSDSLYQLIWKPLEKHLGGIHTIYFAPAGLLHRVAFQALRTDTAQYLIDKYVLKQVISTRSVVLPAPVSSNISSAALWGNIMYDANSSIIHHAIKRGLPDDHTQTATNASSFNFYNLDTRGIRSALRRLPKAKEEMDNLKTAFDKAGITTSICEDSLATEEAFKAVDGKSPQVIHLTTHGFFSPVTDSRIKKNRALIKGVAFKTQLDPMFRNGLILAGGNDAWTGKLAKPDKEDGILTAYEIAQMDLSNTDLVVLSACETGLGDLQGNEGVIGLQRAFKMAGVKQMVVSLWSVYDEYTMKLMTVFYQNLLSGQSARDSLRSAQLKLKEIHPHPYDWAGFVIIE